MPTARFELATSGFVDRRSIQLSYAGIEQHTVGDEGVEPSLTDSESAVLPLNESPIDTRCAEHELNMQPFGYQPNALTVELPARIATFAH